MDFISCLMCSQGAAADVEPLSDDPELAAINKKVVRSGALRVKKQGMFSGWKTKWVVLQGESLIFYNSEPSPKTKQAVINLRDVQSIERVDIQPYCLLLETNNPSRRYLLSLKSDGELYDWQDDVYLRTPKGEGSPFDFKHDVHVGVDPTTGEFTTTAEGQNKGHGGLITALGTTLDTLTVR